MGAIYLDSTLEAEAQPVDFDPQWYALRVLPQREYVVGYLLEQRGISTFIPTDIRTHKRSTYSKGKAEFAVPMIPGIVFAGFPSAPAWYHVMRIGLITGAIGADGVPARLDFVSLLRFFSGVHDGRMVFDGGIRLIRIPGREHPVRALTTRTRVISSRRRAEKRTDRPERDTARSIPVVKAPARYADFIARFVYGGVA